MDAAPPRERHHVDPAAHDRQVLVGAAVAPVEAARDQFARFRQQLDDEQILKGRRLGRGIDLGHEIEITQPIGVAKQTEQGGGRELRPNDDLDFAEVDLADIGGGGDGQTPPQFRHLQHAAPRQERRLALGLRVTREGQPGQRAAWRRLASFPFSK